MSEQVAAVIFAQPQYLPLCKQAPFLRIEEGVAFERAFGMNLEAGTKGTRMELARIAEMGYPEQPTHPICHGVGARAHEPPYAHQAGGGELEAGMVLAIEPGCYWEGGGGLRVEDNFLITEAGAEKLSPFPDGVVRA